MKALTKIFLFLAVLTCVLACSRKKNTFLNRNWHAITAKYNTLYNGNLALELGKEEIKQTYQDDYWNILPVERMHLGEKGLAPETSVNTNFAVAEEKAVKAIQRHSMLIEGREKNPQIDEAYLLLGKARYYDQRFIPALEAFNYILHKYPLSNTINEAKIWREKTNMRLGFNKLAISNLKQVLEDEDLERNNRASASAAVAQAFMNIAANDSAVYYIQKAAELTRNEEKEGRYWYIAGQLFDLLEKKNEAKKAYQKVISVNRQTPRIYFIHAQLAQLRNTQDDDQEAVLEFLMDLSEQRENRPFLDRIYFEMAERYNQMDSTALAIEYYNRSLASQTSDPFLEALSYETLGNINFEAAHFEAAGAYYDSTLQKLDQNSRGYRVIKRKRENLDDVIYYENMAASTDSILRIARLPKKEQLEFFTAYTDQLREEVSQEQDEKMKAGNEAENFFDRKRPSMPGIPTPETNFYFYNPTTVAFGEQEFSRTWGDREPVDNWRTDGNAGAEGASNREIVSSDSEEDPRLDPQTYLYRVPDEPAVLDSLEADRNFAYYQLGIIYREKFDENELAADILERLLQHEPEERLILPAKYHLYKIYMDLGRKARAEAVGNEIVVQFPDSRYAAILQNPESLRKETNNPTKQYQELYKLYEEEHYEEVINESRRLTQKYAGDEIVPKFELLKAMAEGRLQGLERYKEALNFVALNYPQAPEGKKAQNILDTAIPTLPQAQFHADTGSASYKLVFPFSKEKQDEVVGFQTKLRRIVTDLPNANLKMSMDIYDSEQVFVVVHGFSSKARAEGFAASLSETINNQIHKNSFYISTPNYRILQIHKNLEKYFNFLTPPTNVRTGKKESANI